MDLRWLLVVAVVTGVVGFLFGRRTSPGGRAVHRLQRAIDAKQTELNQHREQMRQFVGEMQTELERVSGAYQTVQAKLRNGAQQFVPGALPATNNTITQQQKARLTDRRVSAAMPNTGKTTASHSAVASGAGDNVGPEWSARLAGSWSGTGGGPSLASAAACPLPEPSMLEAPKDYPAPRRSGSFDEHSFA